MPRARQGADRTRLGKPRQAGVRRDAGVEVRAAPRPANMMAWGRIGIRGCIVGDSCSDSPAAGAHVLSCGRLCRRRCSDRLRAQRCSVLPLQQGSVNSLLNRKLGCHLVSRTARRGAPPKKRSLRLNELAAYLAGTSCEFSPTCPVDSTLAIDFYQVLASTTRQHQ